MSRAWKRSSNKSRGRLTVLAAAAQLAIAAGLFALGARDPGPPPATPIEAVEPAPDEDLAFTAAEAASPAPAAATDNRQSAEAPEPAGAAARATATAGETEPAASSRPPQREEPAPMRILVSLDERMLWLVDGADTLLAAPVAIGMGRDFEYEGKKYHFATPRGTRRVIGKVESPMWTPPDWHYKEKAARKGIELVRLEKDSKIELSDGSFIVVVQDQVGRVTRQGYFHPFTPGIEIIFDDKIFVPPMHTAQRKVPDALGPYKLDTGNGYLIHGTHMYNEESIGEAVSHGCVRMNNSDLETLYQTVPIGTPVEIF